MVPVRLTSPLTWSFFVGVVIPIPTFPALSITILASGFPDVPVLNHILPEPSEPRPAQLVSPASYNKILAFPLGIAVKLPKFVPIRAPLVTSSTWLGPVLLTPSMPSSTMIPAPLMEIAVSMKRANARKSLDIEARNVLSIGWLLKYFSSDLLSLLFICFHLMDFHSALTFLLGIHGLIHSQQSAILHTFLF